MQVAALPFHALRNTAATFLLLQGVQAKVVQKRLGHATIAMALDTCSSLIPSIGRAIADKLDAPPAWPCPRRARPASARTEKPVWALPCRDEK